MKRFLLLLICGGFLVLAVDTQALNAEDIYKKVSNSVYTIYTVNFYDKSPESLGSAIAVTDHVLATNCHVALTGNYLGIVLNNEFKLGTIFFRDINRDICFVEVPGVKFAPVKIRNTQDVHVGEQVYAIGNPEGLEKSISQGIISNKRKDRGGYVLQTDATVSFGSSGGGLFDKNGDLIGITNSVDRYSKHIAFAIPSEWISQILFPRAVGNEKKNQKEEPKQLPNQTEKKTITKMGNYGKANIILYRYGKKCFIFFTGKNEYGETTGSAIWYPEKPNIILIFPNSTDVNKNFQIMNQAFYGSSDETPTYSKDFLQFGNQKFELVGVQDENGKFTLLVTKLPSDAKMLFPQLKGFEVTYGDGQTVQGYQKVIYGLDGYQNTMSAYNKQCQGDSASAKPSAPAKP
jgi:serine protease Do